MNIQDELDTIAADAASGNMVFSTHTDVALRVQRALDDPNCSIEKLKQLISAEPMLSARVVSIANSVAYNPAGRDSSDVRSAISRLGFATLKSVTASVIVRQMQAMAKTPEHLAMAEQLWEHTAHVAALARTIARKVTLQDPEEAFFAGIVHEIGSFYLLSRAATYPDLLEDGMQAWYDGGETLVGRAVAQALGIPANILDGLEKMWEGYMLMPPQGLGDTLLLADRLSPVESPFNALEGAVSSEHPADIELLIGDKLLSEIMAESAEEVASLSRALQS